MRSQGELSAKRAGDAAVNGMGCIIRFRELVPTRTNLMTAKPLVRDRFQVQPFVPKSLPQEGVCMGDMPWLPAVVFGAAVGYLRRLQRRVLWMPAIGQAGIFSDVAA